MIRPALGENRPNHYFSSTPRSERHAARTPSGRVRAVEKLRGAGLLVMSGREGVDGIANAPVTTSASEISY